MSNKKNRINIIIYGHQDIVEMDKSTSQKADEIDIRTFLENEKMFEKKNIMGNQKTLVFKIEVKLENEVKFNCFLHATYSEQQLIAMAKNSVGLILIFDPDKKQSLELLENIFNDSAKKKKNL